MATEVTGEPIVFISSTVEDLQPFRAAAEHAAKLAGFRVEMMEYFGASGRESLDECLARVARAHVVVCISAHRLGWVPAEQPVPGGKSVTQLECEQAVSQGVEILPFLVDPDATWPQDQRDEFRHRAGKDDTATPGLADEIQREASALQGFKEWLSTRPRETFETSSDLGLKVLDALHKWRARHTEFAPVSPPLHGKGPDDAPGGRPFSVAPSASPSLDAGSWPTVADETVHMFIASQGFFPASAYAVVACVVVDGLAEFEAGWRSGVASILEDPHLADDPEAAAAVRRRDFGYMTAAALRLRIARLLRLLRFEAYAGFTRQNSGVPKTSASLLDAVVFDRLRAYRDRIVAVHVANSDAAHLATLCSTVREGATRVRGLHADALEPAVHTADPRAIGAIVVEHVAAIVQERIVRGNTATTFNQIHPTKVRVIYELESSRYFTRHDPFAG